MVLSALDWFWNHYRPTEGWLPFFLLGSTIACLVGAVLEVEWVPEDGVVVPAAMLGLLLGVVLAKRPLRWLTAWALIVIYGLLITVVELARLWPPLSILLRGWDGTSQYWRQNGALFIDRVASWFVAAVGGATSQETIVFAFGLGLFTWLLAAYAGWSTFRHHRPLLGLTLMALALAVNGYYGQANATWAALFVGLTALLTAVIHYANLEQTWRQSSVDYSDEVRFDLVLYAGGIATLLLMIALLLPAFSITDLSRLLLRQPAVTQAEQTLERVFAGVQQPRRYLEEVAGPGGPGGRGVMPRSYLLGNPPELQETVVMTAAIAIQTGSGQTRAAAAGLLDGTHWRALSYDVYTGRGWALSEERQEPLDAGESIPLPPVQAQTLLWQSVHWLYDDRFIRYTLGQPLSFDQDVSLYWRGLEDLARVQGNGRHYQATSRLVTATPAELRQAATGDVPPAILARYTGLPANVPERVRELAQEVAGDLPTAYDQARALEQFLRQYPYSLDVPLPPDDVDPVDYFLFELQTGYCDYYASTMAVMARALGLPARLAVGFLPQPAGDNGAQIIRHVNGHSWTEIYFAGFGWVEFEPTAAFTTPHDNAAVDDSGNPFADFAAPTPVAPLPIPEPAPQRPFSPLWWPAAALILLLLAWWRWQQWLRGQERDTVLWAYGSLQRSAQKLGQPIRPQQTPGEFTAELLAHLNALTDQPGWGQSQLARLVDNVRPQVERLTGLFIARRYGNEPRAGTAAAHDIWRRLRRPLWLLRLVARLRG